MKLQVKGLLICTFVAPVDRLMISPSTGFMKENDVIGCKQETTNQLSADTNIRIMFP